MLLMIFSAFSAHFAALSAVKGLGFGPGTSAMDTEWLPQSPHLITLVIFHLIT
jgi:hypothetical protein